MNEQQTLEELNTLEHIVGQLQLLIPKSQPLFAEAIDAEGKSAQELKELADNHYAAAKMNAVTFYERVKGLETLVNTQAGQINILSLTQEARIMIAEVQQAQAISQEAYARSEELYTKERTARIAQAGFANEAEVVEEWNTLQTLKRKPLLSRFKFRKKMKELEERLEPIRELAIQLEYEHETPELKKWRFHNPNPLPKYDLRKSKEAQQQAFVAIAKPLLTRYHEILAAVQPQEQTIAPDILETMITEYATKYLWPDIKEALEQARIAQSFPGERSPEESGLAEDALAIAIEYLNLNMYENGATRLRNHRMNSAKADSNEHSDEEFNKAQEKAEALERQFKALPYPIRNAIKERTDQELGREFDTYATAVAKLPLDRLRESVYFSAQHSGTRLAEILKNLPEEIQNGLWSIRHDAETVKWQSTFAKSQPLIPNLQKWDLFKNNTHIQETYGKDALNEFNSLIRNSVFEEILHTPPSANEKDKPEEYSGFWFNDPQAVAYNTLNFWRKHAYRNSFLTLGNNGKSLAVQYLTKLTPEQMQEIEKSSIPGLAQIIELADTHPHAFKDHNRPLYEPLAEAMQKLCSYYLEQGTDKERVFALETAATLMVERDQQDSLSSTLRKAMINALDFDESVRAQFEKHSNSFARKIYYSSSSPVTTHRSQLIALSEYFDSLDALLETSTHPDSVQTEAKNIEETLEPASNNGLLKWIGYLKAYDHYIVQNALKPKTRFHSVGQKLILTIKGTLRQSSNGIEDAEDYVLTCFNQLANMIIETDTIVKNSAAPDILEEELARRLETIPQDQNMIANLSYLATYLNALNETKTARRFQGFEKEIKDAINWLASSAYTTEQRLTIGLIRKIIEKEKSLHRLRRIPNGLRFLGENKELLEHTTLLFEEQPNAAYNLLTSISLSTHLLTDYAQDTARIFGNHGTLQDYGLNDTVINALISQGLTEDHDLLTYCMLMQLQGKHISDKNLLEFAKTKSQLNRYEAQVENQQASEESRESAQKQLAERKQKITRIVRNERTNALHSALLGHYNKALDTLVGEPQSVSRIDEDVINAVLLYSEINYNKDLLRDLIRDSLKGSPHQVYEDIRNQQAVVNYAARGINMQTWLDGIIKMYTPALTEKVEKARETRIREHRWEALQLYAQLGIETTEENLFESYEALQQDTAIPEEVKQDLKTQLHAIRSLEQATYNSRIGEVTISVEHDPLKILQMGNVVSGSCLGLGRGNSFSTVANAVDINKRVLYATMDGEIIARKLIALNDRGELVQFRTYNNRLDLAIDDLFRQYLQEFAKETSATLGNDGFVPTILSQKWYNDGIVPFNDNRQ